MFGIRTEKREDGWHLTWAFPMNEETAHNEEFDKNSISGHLELELGYPGCPHCEGTGIVRCGACGKVSCQAENASHFKCPWCGNEGETVSSSDFREIRGGGY